jgi:hypothetical protein
MTVAVQFSCTAYETPIRNLKTAHQVLLSRDWVTLYARCPYSVNCALMLIGKRSPCRASVTSP